MHGKAYEEAQIYSGIRNFISCATMAFDSD
jgi:hypothetical protein